jgi:hypothetical protein
MKTIQIVFSKSTAKFAPFSWAIMWGEDTAYSHVSVRMIDDETGLPVYYQASHTMVNCMGEPQWLSQEQIINKFTFQIDDKLQKDFKAFAISKLGVPYGVEESFGLAWVLLNRKFGKLISNPFTDVGSTYVCSQFVAALLQNANVPALSGTNLNNMTPADLFPVINALPATITSA